jgi:hypothetical protein
VRELSRRVRFAAGILRSDLQRSRARQTVGAPPTGRGGTYRNPIRSSEARRGSEGSSNVEPTPPPHAPNLTYSESSVGPFGAQKADDVGGPHDPSRNLRSRRHAGANREAQGSLLRRGRRPPLPLRHRAGDGDRSVQRGSGTAAPRGRRALDRTLRPGRQSGRIRGIARADRALGGVRTSATRPLRGDAR